LGTVIKPLFFAPRRSPEDIYMVIGKNGDKVHTKNQLILWEAYGRPEYFAWNRNHFPTIFFNLFNHDSILYFLERRLNKETR
jgi:hypothetical protein